MKNFLIPLILCASLNADRIQYSNIVELVNKQQAGWTAKLSSDINYDDENSLIGRLGAIPITDADAQSAMADNKKFPQAPVKETKSSASLTSSGPRKLQTAAVSAYPSSLDLRTKYPACSSISLIRNQGRCGSCWAFSSMNSLSDRWCIAKSGITVDQKFFSAEDALECCASCSAGTGNGCRGGMISFAFKYARDVGVVSGEVVSQSGFCKPYYLDLIRDNTNTAPQCNSNCTNPTPYTVPYALDRTQITGYSVGKGEDQLIAALNNGGSVAVGLQVYQDLYSYHSGIYKYVSGTRLGGHAVRLIGYGEENGVKYWLLANSWGTYWGENGFFRMSRGTDECRIESTYFSYGLI